MGDAGLVILQRQEILKRATNSCFAESCSQ
jgi:hypothetical protein